jgi:hypothetical protein
MTQTHSRATLAAATRATLLVPVDVDAAADAASMLTALHERVERQFALYDDADGSPAEQHRAVTAIAAALATHVVLMQSFRQHARDAEALLIPELRRQLDPAERELLGRRLLERIGQLERRPRPGW